ncbi:MAG TPA: ABC transporter substrate-binding protein [Burkholderiales bacterium]|nr:ABC transporter substrate-binding protein [Burkholderiales bacterium]
MTRCLRHCAATLLFAALSVGFDVQGADDMPVVGILRASSPVERDPTYDALDVALQRVGYVIGKNIRFEQRFAERDPKRLPGLADELVRMKVDLIIAGNEASVRAAKSSTSTIPIIAIAYDHDPVAVGLIQSMRRPGGNITGIYSRQVELAGKRLELLKDAVPGLKQVAVLHEAVRPAPARLDVLGKQLALQLRPVPLANTAEFIATLKRVRADSQAATLLYSPRFFDERERLGASAIEAGLPVMAPEREFAAAGVLMSYGPDRQEIAGRVAYLVDRLLRGASPADLPFEEATRFKFAVNMKTAKALGIRIPQSVLDRADEVIR